MPVKNLFKEPFDEGTIAKLEIFENYLDSWLPTFILSDYKKPIQVFDLFAGAGYDKNHVEGSTLRSLKIIRKHAPILRNKNKIVHLYINDINSDFISNLTEYCNDKIEEYSINDVVKLIISNISFMEFLKTNKSLLESGCNLIFIDQNGFKEVSENVFNFLICLDTTEFLFFISSSYIHRFADETEVQKFHRKFDFEKIKNSNRKVIHNVICREFEKYVPSKIKQYSLIPFSIMKKDNNNVYGLIFVSKHIRGADKFLDVAWKMNIINGNANFDIDDDSKKYQLDIFKGKLLTKIEAFQNNLEELILSKKLLSNLDVYMHTLNEGHIPKHAYNKIQKMKKDKLIDYDGKSPLVNYKQTIKENRIIKFRVLTNETI